MQSKDRERRLRSQNRECGRLGTTAELCAFDYVKRHAYDTMTTAAEYRQYADESLVAMRAAMIPEVRAALFIAAQRWGALADQVEEEEALPATDYDRRSRRNSAGPTAGRSSS
jgi:hypothetical protein